MANITWTARAEFDLEYHARRIARDSVAHAIKWMAKIRAKVAMLESLPEIGSPVEDLQFPGFRELIVRNFRIVYRVRNGDCEIIAILRAEQDINRAFGSEPPT